MNRSEILQALDTEIKRLQEARTLLAESPETFFQPEPARRGPGRPKGSGSSAKSTRPSARRTLSAEGRARIAAAQKQRWAKLHKSQAAAAKPAKKQSLKGAGKAVKATGTAAGKKTAETKTARKKSAEKKTPEKQVAA